ncbi:amidohydrolase 3 [Stipitochalara longipes BDJ]|nr:amidohydrolase 3 [Stipitochalara longipes BDJ]
MQNGKFSAAPAMAIKDGKVAAIGTYEAAKDAAGSFAKERDLQSQCIVPGFIEPHLHILLSAMLKGFLINCDPLNPEIKGSTFQDTIDFIKLKYGNLKEKNQWLLGYGFDPSRLPLDKNCKFQDLTFDAFAKANLNDHSIFIINASGHLAYANQKAFDEAGINKDTPNPPGGGEYVKDGQGNLTGILKEPSTYEAFLHKALPTNLTKIPKIVAGLREVVKDWSARGFTTVFDAGIGQTSKWEASMLYILSLVAPLRIAGAAANLTKGAASEIVGIGNMPPDGATSLKIKTIKLWMDGSTQGFTAALEKSYNKKFLPDYFCEEPNGWARWAVGSTCPIDNTACEQIADEMLAWAIKGYQLMVHVNGDCAAEVVLNAFEKVVAIVPPKPPIMHRLEHFTVTTREQVQRAKKLNLGVSHTIGHVKYWGYAFSNYILDFDRADRIDPVKDDLESELVYSFNSDSPVSQADALSFVSTAATRRMYKDGVLDGVLGQDQTVNVEAALAGVTINPAKQVMLDSEIGSLEKGKDANFVILTQDISSVTVDAKDIDSTWVKETWFKGVKRHS